MYGKPIVYFSTTLVITTIFWLIGAYFSFDQSNGFYMVFLLIGLMTPFFVAYVMILNTKDPKTKSLFYKKLFDFKRFDLKFLPLFFLIMPVSVLISVLVSPLFGESLDQQLVFSQSFSFSTGFVPVLLLLFLAAIFEELGWRGYGFESLRVKNNFFYASLLFSILWSLWHFPLIFVNNSYQYEIYTQNYWYAVNFFVSIIPMGMIVSWVCYKNSSSILAAILFHFVINLSQEALEITQTTKIIQTFVLCLFVVIIVYKNRDIYYER